MNRSMIVSVVFIALASASTIATAYEIQTHELLTGKALSSSVLVQDPQKLKQLGLLFSVDSDFRIQEFPNSRNVPKNIRKLITEGAVFEDQPATRVMNHFYEPLTEIPLTIGGFKVGSTSPDWALEDKGDITGTLGFGAQEFSYKDARKYFYDALTKPVETDRRKNFGLTLESLGHIAHHLQDMAQPQHVRNDRHLELPGTKYEVGLCLFAPIACPLYFAEKTPSLYESWTNKLEVRENLPFSGVWATPVYSAENPGSFTTPRQFWSTVEGKGIADYTNRGFVSAGTNFDKYSQPGAFGSPAVDPARKVELDIQQLCANANPPCENLSLSGKITFYGNTVEDRNVPSNTAINPYASSLSIFDADLKKYNSQSGGSQSLFSLNQFNFRLAHALLIPRAVGYSAGLINYFFRGQMEITPPDEGVYGVVDHSTIQQTDPLNGFVGFGKIKLKLKNTTPGGEAMNGGSIVAVAKFHRNGCYKDDLTGEFLAATFPNPPCANYRTNTEEIVLSSSVADAAGNPVTSVNLSTTAEQQYTFTFSQPIPINATDLFIQVVYKGPLGVENDAVVVATKDVFEPTYYAIFNSTDQIFYNGAFLPTNTSPPPADLDANNDGVIDPIYDKTGLKVLFAFSDSPFDVFSGNKIANLPPGRFSRYAVLTGRSPYALQTFATNQGIVTPTNFVTTILDPTPTAATNQLDPVSNTYRVTTYSPLRGVAGGNASLTYFRTVGANTNGDLTKLPDLVDKTPFPITCLRFNSPNPC